MDWCGRRFCPLLNAPAPPPDHVVNFLRGGGDRIPWDTGEEGFKTDVLILCQKSCWLNKICHNLDFHVVRRYNFVKSSCWTTVTFYRNIGAYACRLQHYRGRNNLCLQQAFDAVGHRLLQLFFLFLGEKKRSSFVFLTQNGGQKRRVKKLDRYVPLPPFIQRGRPILIFGRGKVSPSSEMHMVIIVRCTFICLMTYLK